MDHIHDTAVHCQYLNDVGYKSTVAVFKTFEPIPLATRRVSKDVWSHGMSTNTQANPHAPHPAKIETITTETY